MLFSIIVPMYNVKQYADKCINSIIKQTYRDFEAIIVDDGSNDGTSDIIDFYANNDERIIPIHKTNGGIVSARKAGVAVANGEFIVNVDGDDWLEENALEIIAEEIRNSSCDVICFGFNKVVENEYKTPIIISGEKKRYNRNYIERNIITNFFPNGKSNSFMPNLWNKAFKREKYTEICLKVDDRIDMGEDGVITYACMYSAYSICILPEVLYNYRLSPNSLTRKKTKYITWECADLRITMYSKIWDESDTMQDQIARFTVHAYFNVILSHLNNEKYSKVRKEARERLKDERISTLIKNSKITENKKLLMAKIALRYKWIWLIKLYSIFA